MQLQEAGEEVFGPEWIGLHKGVIRVGHSVHMTEPPPPLIPELAGDSLMQWIDQRIEPYSKCLEALRITVKQPILT
jgi:hypothetical protein